MPLDVGGYKINSNVAKSFKYKDIITNGLVMYLDADSPESYPGSGTLWYDLSNNNNNGTLVNGPTYTTNGGFGVIQFDGSNDYVDVPGPNLSSTNYTVIAIARYVTVDSGAGGIESGRTISGRNNNWLLGHWNGYTENHYAEGWVSTAGGGTSDTNWRFYACTGNISADVYNFYVNNSLINSNNGGSQGPNGFGLGKYFPLTENSNSQIGFVMAYNRTLSTSELTRIYNAFKYRIGL